MTKVNEQKPTEKAMMVAHSFAPVVEGMAGMFTCLWCKWTWDYDEDPRHEPLCAVHSIATALAARDAEIQRLQAGGCARDQRLTQFCAEAVRLQGEITQEKERTSKVWAIHADSIAKSVVRESKLQAENQQQRALLVEALRLVKAEKQGVLSIDRPYFDQKVKEFLSNPAVVELLKGVGE